MIIPASCLRQAVAAIMASGVRFAITRAPSHMFVADISDSADHV
ncbi:uncharacterized protein YcsI (UPF0317 family) [Rhizobium sp. BK049]|nr:uncharacterized protein YcsI (UPF0317 family) [Rhizobium sp. BK049]